MRRPTCCVVAAVCGCACVCFGGLAVERKRGCEYFEFNGWRTYIYVERERECACGTNTITWQNRFMILLDDCHFQNNFELILTK